jgi:LAS superfamily LD-carboxypeptidase LdcB
MVGKMLPKPQHALVMKDKISIQRIDELHPKVREDFRKFIAEAEDELGVTLRVTQGLRSFSQQQILYNQPSDKKDNDGDGKVDEADEKVTAAKPGSSYHQYGLAADLVEIKDGKANWSFDYSKLLPFATKYGIAWGGLFKSFKDKPHFEKPMGNNWRTLLDKYNKKDFIPGTQFVNI